MKDMESLFTQYKERVIGLLIGFVLALLLVIFGFWQTILVIILSMIGYGVGYCKERHLSLRDIINKWIQRGEN
ncbi:DUF2273 domain-containing protein [Vagococcus entomophilus]|uniref:DUF2273 domain-containing protein n=1 Tax=Vagococcus entomophilus TaxID=1160095 RepID=A0A430AGV7_9ENTE|nr:DUF2273 domain-containing protein [Vagococcus entomophilus]RSU07166.1 hypothetical protein CBF30_07900 [Vagococcus entomophilus]